MTTQPLVSVILPTYNRVHVIGRAIASVENQGYGNYELIIADDRSIDNTEGLVRKRMATNSRIKYVTNEYAQGPAGARNFALTRAGGEYIAFLDSDDYWLPGHLVEGIAFMQENPNVGLLFTDRITLDTKTGTRTTFLAQYPPFHRLQVETRGKDFRIIRQGLFESFMEGNFVTLPTSIVRAASMADLRFDESLPVASDRDFLIRLEFERNCVFAARLTPCLVVTRHEGNLSVASAAVDLRYLEARVKSMRNLTAHGVLTQQQRDMVERCILVQISRMPYYHRRLGRYRDAFRTLLRYGSAFSPASWLMETAKTAGYAVLRRQQKDADSHS